MSSVNKDFVIEWLRNSLLSEPQFGIRTETYEQSEQLADILLSVSHHRNIHFWDDVKSSVTCVDAKDDYNDGTFGFHRTEDPDKNYISFEEFMSTVSSESPSLLELLEVN